MNRTSCFALWLFLSAPFALAQQTPPKPAIREFLVLPQKRPSAMLAITGVRLIEGTGRAPRSDMTMLVLNGRIHAVGPSQTTVVPKDTETVDGGGLTLLPGLMDSHFHLDVDGTLPALFLSPGVTSVRDPGTWIEAYEGMRQSKETQPRLFLAGPHIDGTQPAYPTDSVVLCVTRRKRDWRSSATSMMELP